MKTDVKPILNFEELLETLRNFKSQLFDDLIIDRTKNGRIEISGFLPINRIDEFSKVELINEMDILKEKFNQLVNMSNDFKVFVLSAGVDYFLCMEDGGCSIAVCSEILGKFYIYYH